jgi:hypothetical protein
MKTAAASRYAVVIHPRLTASRANDVPIAGRATLREETVNGTRNEASENMKRRILFCDKAVMPDKI